MRLENIGGWNKMTFNTNDNERRSENASNATGWGEDAYAVKKKTDHFKDQLKDKTITPKKLFNIFDDIMLYAIRSKNSFDDSITTIRNNFAIVLQSYQLGKIDDDDFRNECEDVLSSLEKELNDNMEEANHHLNEEDCYDIKS